MTGWRNIEEPAERKDRQTVIALNLVSAQTFSLSCIFSVTSPNHNRSEVLRSLFSGFKITELVLI